MPPLPLKISPASNKVNLLKRQPVVGTVRGSYLPALKKLFAHEPIRSEFSLRVNEGQFFGSMEETSWKAQIILAQHLLAWG